MDAIDAFASFKCYLSKDKCKRSATINDHVLAMQRVFHMIEVNGVAIRSQ